MSCRGVHLKKANPGTSIQGNRDRGEVVIWSLVP